jgi:hypothetical protein
MAKASSRLAAKFKESEGSNAEACYHKAEEH